MSLVHWDKLTDETRAMVRVCDPSAEEVFRHVIGNDCANLRNHDGKAYCICYNCRPRFCRAFPCHPDHAILACTIKLVPAHEVKP
jgi:hypothetical protein